MLNQPLEGATVRSKGTPTETRDFARRLHQAMESKGWTQSQLAKEAFGCRKDYRGVVIPNKRDQLSAYINGRRLPDANNLKALAKALGLRPADLLPSQAISAVDRGEPSVQFTESADGRILLKAYCFLEKSHAARVMAVLYDVMNPEPRGEAAPKEVAARAPKAARAKN